MHQHHMGCLASEIPLDSRKPMPLGVQGRLVTISQNKPKAIIKHCTPDAFLFSDPILVHQCLNCRDTESYQGHHDYIKILVHMQLLHSIQLKGQNTIKTQTEM